MYLKVNPYLAGPWLDIHPWDRDLLDSIPRGVGEYEDDFTSGIHI